MGLTEEYSTGDSLSALRSCFEEVVGEVIIYVILVKGVCVTKHTSKQKVAASHKKVASSHKEQMSSLMI